MRPEKQLVFWLVAVVLVLLLIGTLRDILLPFIAAMVIAYFLSPVADRLQALGLGRGLAAVLIVGLLGVLIVLAFFFLLPVLVGQMRQLVAALPGELGRLKSLVESLGQAWLGPNFPAFQAALDRAVADLSQNWAGMAGVIMASVWSRGLAIVNFLALLLITPVVVFYLLVDWHPMMRRVDDALPRAHAATIRRLAGEINDALSAFIRGQGAICLMLGVFYAAGLSWAGIEYGLLVGLTTGLLAFIPVIGWTLGLIATVGLGVVQHWPDPTPLLKAVAVLGAGLAADAAFLSPRFVGQKIGLHPVWLIFALFVFSYLFGLVGTLVAVPLAAAAAVLVRFAFEVYLASTVYTGGAVAEPRPSPGSAGP